MENTYLDPEAMLVRIKNLEEKANKIYQEIGKSKIVMDDLKENFSGTSAMRVQTKYDELEATFGDLLKYLQEKAEMMEELTKNVTRADEE